MTLRIRSVSAIAPPLAVEVDVVPAVSVAAVPAQPPVHERLHLPPLRQGQGSDVGSGESGEDVEEGGVVGVSELSGGIDPLEPDGSFPSSAPAREVSRS